MLTLDAFAQAERLGMIVPAYQYPTQGSLWSDCAAAARRVPLVAVLNPANGPGNAPDPFYVEASNGVRTAGGRVIGYVPTFQASIPLATAIAWVDQYRAWYSLDGVYLDGMSTDANPEHVAWYTSLRDAIRSRESTWLVVGGPGANTRPEYLPTADIFCIHEAEGASYFNWQPDAWVLDQPASRFLHLVHSLAASDSMRAAVARAKSLRAQWVFVTHDRMPNPWDDVPAYWDALVAAVETTQTVSAPSTAERGTRLAAWPNPSRGAIQFRLPDELASQEIEVLDAAGREIALLHPARSPRWDGRDLTGTSAPPGIYFARVRGARTPPLRLVVIR